MKELVKPTDDTLEQVHDWLFDNGIDNARLSYNEAKDWIKVSLPVSAVEKLLDTEYSIYEHEDGGWPYQVLYISLQTVEQDVRLQYLFACPSLK